jgi:hypothetical protein
MSGLQRSGPAMVSMLCLALSGAIAAADALTQLGVPVEIARQEVNAGVEHGRVDYSMAAAAFKAASEPVRAQLTQAAIGWAKSYTASDEFKVQYAAMREARRPPAPGFEGTPEDQRQRALDEQTKEVETAEAALASMDVETRRQAEDAIRQAAAAIRQLDTPEMRTMQLAGIRYARADAEARHLEVTRRWEAEYPEAPSRLIARRLQTFLDVSADVDFSAKLEPRNGRMRFVDPAYERRSSEWKLCYRAGKAAVDAAREAATAWLLELDPARARP